MILWTWYIKQWTYIINSGHSVFSKKSSQVSQIGMRTPQALASVVRCGPWFLRPLKNQMVIGIVMDQIDYYSSDDYYLDQMFQWLFEKLLFQLLIQLLISVWNLSQPCHGTKCKRHLHDVPCGKKERWRGKQHFSFDIWQEQETSCRVSLGCSALSGVTRPVTRSTVWPGTMQSCSGVGGSHGWVHWKMQMILDDCWHQKVFNKSGAV